MCHPPDRHPCGLSVAHSSSMSQAAPCRAGRFFSEAFAAWNLALQFLSTPSLFPHRGQILENQTTSVPHSTQNIRSMLPPQPSTVGPLTTSLTSPPLHSPPSIHTGFLAIPRTFHAHPHLRALASTVPLPGTSFFLEHSIASFLLPSRSLLRCHLFREAFVTA